MIKNIFIIAATLLSISLMAQDKVKVLSSASLFEDMAREVGKELIDIESIVPVGGDPHTYTPKPSDARSVTDADLVIVNGLTFEGWITELIANSGSKAKVAVITDGVKPISSLSYENAADPHAWMDARNVKIYAQNIANALAEVDPKNADAYQANAKKYIAELDATDAYIRAEIAKIPEQQRVLITSHDAFQYYGKAYGIELNAIQGISTEAEARAKDVQRVIDAIKKKNVPAVFIESTINPKMLKQIADDTGASIGGELFADSLGDKDGPAGTYIGMMRHNTDVIVKALSGKGVTATKIDTDDTSSNIMIYGIIGALMLLSLLLFLWKMNK